MKQFIVVASIIAAFVLMVNAIENDNALCEFGAAALAVVALCTYASIENNKKVDNN